MFTGTIGDLGPRTVEVSAPNCPKIEEEFQVGSSTSTLCGYVVPNVEEPYIEGCDGLTYLLYYWPGEHSLRQDHPELHEKVRAYRGKYVLLTRVVIVRYIDANTAILGSFDHLEEISDCSECVSANFIDKCMEISSPGYYKLISDISNSAAQCCIKITSSDVVFDGNGHYIDGLEAQDTCGVCVGSSGTLSNVTVKNVTVRRWGTGILFSGVENGKIKNNQARWNKDYGILIRDSRHNDIRNNIAESNMDGIYLMDCNSNIITDNTASANDGGIGFIRSSSNNVIKNSASGGYLGIDLYQNSNNNNIANNTVEYNLNHGLYIDSSSTGNSVNQNVICSNNRIDGEYYDICNNATNTGDENTCDTTYNWNDAGTTACTYKCRTYDVSNCMEINAPGYYRLTRDILNSTAQCCIKITATHVIFDGQKHIIRGVDGLDTCGVCVNSTSMLSDVTIENLTVNNWHYGLYFQNLNNGKIDNNSASHNKHGIIIANSSNNYITNNNASHNLLYGIYLGYWHETIYIKSDVKWSSYNTVRNNTASNNDGGIVLRYAKDNTLTNNTAEYNNDGLTMFSGSTHNSITDNIFCSNKLYDLFDEPYYEYVVDKAVMKEKANSGSNNTCDATYSWNDTGTVGCRYKTCWYKQPRPPVFNSPAVFPFSKIFLGDAPDHLLDKALLSGTVAINITAPDPFGELLSVNLTLYKNEVRILTIPLRHTSGTEAWQERWDTTQVADGAYTMEATSTYSTSTGMFRYSASLPLILDNTPPSITIDNPKEGQEIYGYICVMSTAQDANGIQRRVNWTLDGKCFANWTAYQLCSLSRPVGPIGVPAELAKGMALLDTSEFENGAYTLKAEATDFVGNTKTSEINVDITTAPISIEEVTIEDPGYYGDYYERGYFRLYTLGTNIVQIKVKLKNSGDSDGKAVVSLKGLDQFFKCFYVPDRVITVPANKIVNETWTFNISHYDPLNGWIGLLKPKTYNLNVSVNSLSKKKVLDYNAETNLTIREGAAFKCIVTRIDYEEVDNDKLDVGENFLLKFKIENVGDEDVHDITVYSDRRWDGFMGRHDLWCRKWNRFPNDPGINVGYWWDFSHMDGIISGEVMLDYTKEEVAEVYEWSPTIVGMGRLNFEIEMKYPNSSVNYWTTCLEPVTLQFYEFGKTQESTVMEDEALKVTVLGLGDVDAQARTRDVKIVIENKQKIYYNYRIDNEPTEVWEKMRTFIVPEGRIETVVAAKADENVDNKYQFNVTYKEAWDFNFLNGLFMALSPILPYPLDDVKTVIECTVYAAQDEDIDITKPRGLADWILQHYDQFGDKFVDAAKDHYGVDINKELFKGKLTDLFVLYELGMDVVGVLGWSLLDWADAPVKGKLIVTVLPEGYYVIGEAMPPSPVFTIKTQEVDSLPKSKTSHSQNSTMREIGGDTHHQR
jgi:parallel beta-helix repeat protein